MTKPTIKCLKFEDTEDGGAVVVLEIPAEYVPAFIELGVKCALERACNLDPPDD